jgi:hypothetical protein
MKLLRLVAHEPGSSHSRNVAVQRPPFTEADWLAGTDATRMLNSIGRMASKRKLRLIACAWSRRLWHLLADERSRHAVEVAERFADGRASEQERLDAVHAARKAAFGMIAPEQRRVVRAWAQIPDSPAACAALAAASTAYHDDAVYQAAIETCHHVLRLLYANDHSKGHASSVELVREVFGNPFRPVVIEQGWLIPGVVELARTIYEDLAFDRMPELAATLEQVRCDNRHILAHCWESSEHVRGCWVVDLILGKGQEVTLPGLRH